MDAVLPALFIILGSLLFLVLVLLGLATVLIFAGPPDLHDVDIDPNTERKAKTK
jgi:hypothetical protein